jgi:LysM repeat protein
MKRRLLFLLLLSPLIAQARTSSTTEQERVQRQVSQESFSELRLDVDDMRHALHALQTEVAILDEKLHNQGERATEALSHQLQELKKKIASLEGVHEKIIGDLKQLATRASDSLSLFAQHEEKLDTLERDVAAQHGQLKEIQQIGKTLSSIHTAATDKRATRTYKVQPRDSLEKIARQFQLSVEQIKQLNGLSHDTIFVGQELKLP